MSVETNSHKYTNMNLIFSQFVAAEFPKTPSPKPARIHSPDPFLRAGKFSRGFAKSFSPENSFGKTESALVPPPARILGGQNPERKTPFPFSRKNSPPPNQKCKECFFFRGCWRTRQCVGLSPSVRGSFKPPRTRSVRSHYLTLFWK